MIADWGLHLILDLYDCDEFLISSKSKLREFVLELCDILDVKRYGDPVIEWFGNGPAEGYTLVQLIETSLVSGHFAPSSRTAYIDVFSCKFFDPIKVQEYIRGFFKAKKVDSTLLERGSKLREV